MLAAGASSAPAARHGVSAPKLGSLYTDGQTGRYLLGGTWLYRADRADLGLSRRWFRSRRSTAGWTALTVPNAYNAGDFSTSSWRGYVGWYRKDFRLPTGAFASYVPRASRRWIVRFESVSYRTRVWCNGRLVGTHTGANLPFELVLSGLRAGANSLVVRVDNRHYSGELEPGPGGGWWNYGGILREVYLRAVQRVDIAQLQVRTLLSCGHCAARIEEHALLANRTAGAQTVHLQGHYGRAALNFGSVTIPPHSARMLSGRVRVGHPRLWAPGHPALYRATLTLLDGSRRVLGGYVLLSGIRSIKVTRAGRLTLNGRLLNLRGVEMREQDLRRGAALDPAQLRRLVSRVRSLGATLIRSDPLNPEIEELADRYGLLVWSDIPLGGHVSSISAAASLLTANVVANQQHPSVIVWGIADELATPATAGEANYISHAVALLHRLDRARPVGMSISDWPGVPCQGAYAPLDVIGLNEYFGWYDAGGGTTDDRDALSPFLDSLRACYPKQPLFVTEFGFDGARQGPVEVRGTYRFQANTAAFHLGVFASKPWLSGAVYFLLQDGASGPTYGGGDPFPDPPFNLKGLLDLQGRRKPAWATVASIYHSTVQIARSAR